MPARVPAMEDSRALHAERVVLGLEELLAFLLRTVTLHKTWHDQFPHPVTKGLYAPVVCLLVRLDKGEF